MGIRILLVGGLIVILVLVTRGTSDLRHRIVGSLLFISAVLAILFPDFTIIIANAMGVGRGTDLVFYISFVLFCFLLVVLFKRLRDQDRKLTLLIRALALQNARIPSESSQKKPVSKSS